MRGQAETLLSLDSSLHSSPTAFLRVPKRRCLDKFRNPIKGTEDIYYIGKKFRLLLMGYSVDVMLIED
jgi:hypothetical protein